MELTDDIKRFIFWLDDPHCPFNHCYNGIDKDKPKICYEKNNKHYTIEQVFEIYCNENKLLQSKKLI